MHIRIHHFFLLFFLLLSSCATYQKQVAPARSDLISGNCDSALPKLEKLATKESDDRLAYLLEYATALQACKQYDKSVKAFIEADKLAESLDYTSITKSTAATLVTEELTHYKGDTFEKFFINAMNALNFIQINDLDSALIEVRKLNQKFSKLKAEDKKNFELNAFAKYLSGLIWEAKKDYDDACIDYKDAFFLDTTFRSIGQEMLNVCWKAQREAEFQQISKKMNATAEEIKAAKTKKWTPEVVILILQGWGPQKQPRPEDHRFPYLVSKPTLTKNFSARISEGAKENLTSNDKSKMTVLNPINQNINHNERIFISENIYNVDTVATQTLDKDYLSLVARRAAAQAARIALLNTASKSEKGEVAAASLAAYVFLSAMDRADLRQWSFLPKQIQIIKIPVSSGQHTINIFRNELTGTSDLIYSDEIFTKNINSFIVIRDFK